MKIIRLLIILEEDSPTSKETTLTIQECPFLQETDICDLEVQIKGIRDLTKPITSSIKP
jgi:hypothetical protein